MSHLHDVIDDDPHFTIDVSTREITSTVEEKTVLIQGDHNSERFTFEIPREIDGHDLTTCNLIRIHFINISADDGNVTSPGIYEVTDLEVSGDDPNTLVFSWLIERAATTHVGTLSFVVEFMCKTESLIEYSWHTAICSDAAIISAGLDNSEIIIGEHYDVLDTWIARIDAAAATAKEGIENAVDEMLARKGASPIYRHNISLVIAYTYPGGESEQMEDYVEAETVIYTGDSTSLEGASRQELFAFLKDKRCLWTGVVTEEDSYDWPLITLSYTNSPDMITVYYTGYEMLNVHTLPLVDDNMEGYKITISDSVSEPISKEGLV